MSNTRTPDSVKLMRTLAQEVNMMAVTLEYILQTLFFVFYLVFKFKAEIPSHWQHAKRLKTMANLSSEPVFRGKNVTQ